MNQLDQNKALASNARLQILQWLKEPRTHFPHQVTADPAEIGVCVTLIAAKLGVGQPTASRHLELLRRAGFVQVYRLGRWSYFSRNETGIRTYRDWVVQQL
jgi:ArsR family transcriptional regulator